MEKRPPSMRVRFNLWIENSEGGLLYGRGRHRALKAVEEQGSLSAAAEALEVPFRGLWARMKSSEKRLGFKLMESRAGRGPASGTVLTEQGQAIWTAHKG